MASGKVLSGKADLFALPWKACLQHVRPDLQNKKSESNGKSDSTTAFVSSNAITRSNQSSCLMSKMDTGVFFQTFCAWVGHDANRTYIRGILDGGSERSFIKEDTARKLRLRVVSEIRTELNTLEQRLHHVRKRLISWKFRCAASTVLRSASCKPSWYQLSATMFLHHPTTTNL